MKNYKLNFTHLIRLCGSVSDDIVERHHYTEGVTAATYTTFRVLTFCSFITALCVLSALDWDSPTLGSVVINV